MPETTKKHTHTQNNQIYPLIKSDQKSYRGCPLAGLKSWFVKGCFSAGIFTDFFCMHFDSQEVSGLIDQFNPEKIAAIKPSKRLPHSKNHVKT